MTINKEHGFFCMCDDCVPVLNAEVSEILAKTKTLRDEFAMSAMQSIIMLKGINHSSELCDSDLKISYMYADAAMKVREVQS